MPAPLGGPGNRPVLSGSSRAASPQCPILINGSMSRRREASRVAPHPAPACRAFLSMTGIKAEQACLSNLQIKAQRDG